MQREFRLNSEQIARFKQNGCVLSHNAGNFPRYGLFARWVPKQVEMMKHAAPDGMWKYWGI